MNEALLLFSFLFIKSLFKVNSQKLLSLRLQVSNSPLYINMPIGRPESNMFEILNQDIQYTWTTSRFFNTTISSTSKYLGDSAITFQGGVVQAKDYQDIVTFYRSNVSSPINYKYASLVSILSDDAGSFAFPHIYTDERYSLAHQLKKDRLIDRIAYSIVITIEKGEKLYLGGIPSIETENKQFGSCKVGLNNKRWGCDLTQVYFSKNSAKTALNKSSNRYENSYEMHFQAKEMAINAPLDFMEYITNIALKPYIDNQDCNNNHKDNLHFIECSYKILNTLPDITFVFPSVRVTLPLLKLFDRYSSICKLFIQHDLQLGNEWIFGTYFLMHFNSLFDYETHSVTLYADEGITSTPQPELLVINQLNKGWIVAYVSVLIVGFVWLLLVKVSLLKHKKSNPPGKENSIEPYKLH